MAKLAELQTRPRRRDGNHPGHDAITEAGIVAQPNGPTEAQLHDAIRLQHNAVSSASV